MKAKSTRTLSFLLLLILLFPVNAFAVVWDISNEDLQKVAFELKKFNAHLENLKNTELLGLRGQQEDLLRQIEEIKQSLPQLQGAVELNKSETLSGLDKTNAKLDDLAAEVKNQVLYKIRQQNKTLELFRQEQANLKEGLAQDIEKFEQSSKTNFREFAVANNKTLGRVVQQLEAQSATTKKGFDDTIALFREDVIPTIATENQKSRQMILDQLTQANAENQKNLEAFSAKNQQLNQKLIEILEKSLKQGLDTKSLLDSIKKDMEITHASVEGTNTNLIAVDETINMLAGSLQAQNTASNEALATLKVELEQAKEFNKLADELANEKFNKLIDLSSNLAIHYTELESSVVGQLKDSAQKEDARTIKVDLANERLSRLIEILKAIAKEQEKLGPIATTLGKMQKDQESSQKTQAGLNKTQGEIKEALADLRRKAKAIAKEQEKLGPIATTLGKMQKDQEKLGPIATTLGKMQKDQEFSQKTQAGLNKTQGEIKEALADLRRKANVNISRNDDIKKTLGQLSSSKK